MSEARSRNGWQIFRFDEIATIVNDRIDDPSEADVDYYVGLEHLDSDSLTIRRWGSPNDVEATKLRFRVGDIIFGRRRVYQRKLGVAQFDGICSAHAMVLRAKPDVVLPEFLPFFMQSDLFMERAKEISVGSLSPTINWRTLAREEFELPPLETQRRTAEVMTAITAVSQLHEQAAAEAETVTETFLLEHLKGMNLGSVVYHEQFGEYSEKLPLTPIDDLVTDTQYGLSEPAVNGGQFRMLRMMDLADGVAVDSDSCLVDLSKEDLNRYLLDHGDVLFNRTNSYELVGRTGVYKLDGQHVFASYLIRLKTNADRLLPDYLCAFLNAPVGRRQVMRFATRAVSQTNVNASNLRTVLIPLPPLEYQRRVIEYIEHLREARRGHRQRAKAAAGLARGVANDMLRLSR
jgi:type I restriction enzyme S subunit